jgi:hypothetical protein
MSDLNDAYVLSGTVVEGNEAKNKLQSSKMIFKNC